MEQPGAVDVPDAVKVSSPETGEFWEIPILFSDEHLLALNKPAGLLVSPDPNQAERASLMPLLHRGIERGAPWAKELGVDYLTNPHRLDAEASGVILLARQKEALSSLLTQFGGDHPCRRYVALVRGVAPLDQFDTEAKLAPHPAQLGVMRVDPKEGKRSRTEFAVRERFDGYILLDCAPVPDRPHQISAHLRHLRLPVVGDALYGGRGLYLSTLKPDYRLKKDEEERPLIDRPAVHAEKMEFTHPATGAAMTLSAGWPKDLTASIKYLRRYAVLT